MSICRILFSTFFLFFSILPTLAQKEKEVISLKLLLEQISAQHDVKFNYIEDEIVIFTLVPPPKEWELQSKIEYIKTETKLKFSVIEKKYYTIFNDKKVDKPLCGYLIDSDSDLPIENAIVTILHTSRNTSSNSLGYFELPIISPNAIHINHMSYQPINIDAKELYVGQCPRIKLIPISKELTEVIIQQYLTTGISKKKDGSLAVKPKKFGILPGLIEPDVLQTLQQIPGIYSADETISNLNVRGGTHDQNLFLWNGIRMFQTGHFFGLISAFNPSLAQTISITKNGSSAFFGESVSSLVNISSHSKSIEESNTSISSNLLSAEFYSKLKLSKKASIEVSGRRSYTDFFSSPTYQNYRDRVFQNTIVTNLNTNTINAYHNSEDFYFYDCTLQYQQKIGRRSELTIDGIAIKNNLKINQISNLNSRNSGLSQQNFGGSLLWKTKWNERNSTQLNFSTSYYNLDAVNEAIQSNQIFSQQNSVLDFGFQFKNSHQFSQTITSNYGYQFDEIGVTNYDAVNTPEFVRNVKEVLLSHVGVLEGIYQSLNHKTYLNIGLRANYYQKYQSFVPESRIQFNQALTRSIHLELLGEQKSQTLTQIIDLQQDFLGIEKRRWALANESNIPVQKSNQIAIGLLYQSKSWLVTLDNFYKKISGITSSGQGFQNQFEFIKTIGSYHIMGSEVLIQKNFEKFYTWLSYSLNHNQYNFDLLSNVEFANNFELVHAVSYAAIYDWNTFKIALGCKWHSGKPITTPSSTTVNTDNPANPKINYNSPNSGHLPDYYQLNISASKDWKLNKKTNLEASISVMNLLDKKNIINRFYRINTAENAIESVNTYSLKRTPNINVKISF